MSVVFFGLSAAIAMVLVAACLWLYWRHYRWRDTAAGPWIILTLALLSARHPITALDAWWLDETAVQYLVSAWNLVTIAAYARLLWQLLLWLRRDDPPDLQ